MKSKNGNVIICIKPSARDEEIQKNVKYTIYDVHVN